MGLLHGASLPGGQVVASSNLAVPTNTRAAPALYKKTLANKSISKFS